MGKTPVMRMRVGVVGAGLAGLAAARLLRKEGHEATVFEGSGDVGGRCASRQVNEYLFDTGATSIAPRGKLLEPVMLNELDTSELVRVTRPIYTHSALRVMPGDAAKMMVERFTYVTGNATLPKLMSEGLDIRRHEEIGGIEKSNGVFRIKSEQFDAVVLCMPLPESLDILESMDEQRPIGHVHYRPCLSVLLGYDKEMPEIHYHAIVDPEQRHPLTWLSIESVKCSGRAPEGQTAMVAQLSPQFTSLHYETEDGAIVSSTVEYIERLYGSAWGAPTAFDVKRWKYSQPENLALFDNVNNPSARLVIASDGLIGGRVEYAYEAGARAAKLLIDQAY